MAATRAREVLLAEDDPADLKLTLHVFTKHKLADTVHVVRDGPEVLEFVSRTGRHVGRPGAAPAVIFLDLKLPLMDGTEVLRRIKSDPATSAIPVVVLTSSNEDRDLTTCYHLGANSYIVKSVEFVRFEETVRHLGRYWLLINQPPPG